jgi:hypothetical protein
VGIRCVDYVTPLYPQKVALTSPTGGGRSVGIVRSRTKAMEFFFHINDAKEQFARFFDHSACLINETFIKAKTYTRFAVFNNARLWVALTTSASCCHLL